MSTLSVGDLLNNTEYLDWPIVINWDEGQHPRDAQGRFGQGEGSSLKEVATRMRSSGVGSTESHTSGVTAPVDDILGAIRGGAHTLKASSTAAVIKQTSQSISDLKSALGKKVWDGLSPQDQASLTAIKAGVDKVEHFLEKPYKAGQNAAKEVMKEQGMRPEHIETAGKILGAVDGIARWSVNIPVAHEAIHALTHIGGPIAFLGAKVGYYTPVASLAYVGASLAKAVVRDIPRVFQHAGAAVLDPLLGTKTENTPFDTIRIARAAIRGAMQKQEHGEPHSLEGHLAHGVAGAVHLLGGHAATLVAEGAAHYMSHNVAKGTPDLAAMKRNAPKVANFLKDHDYDDQCVALLYAALDETMTPSGPNLNNAIKYANVAYKKVA